MNRASVPIFGLLLTAAAFAASALLYARLPQAFPVHIGLRGEPDGFVDKPWGPFFFPLMLLGLTALMGLAPFVSPNRFRIEPFAASYRTIACAILGLIAWIDGMLTASVLGAPVDPGRASVVGIGVVIALTGNLYGKVTPNFFVGVKTPWTIASPEVWRRTHRLAAWVMVGAGALVALGAAVGAPIWALFVALIAAALAPPLYSYVIYRRLEPQEPRQ